MKQMSVYTTGCLMDYQVFFFFIGHVFNNFFSIEANQFK